MPVVQIKDLQVHFPFEPYQLQVELMSRVVECLQNGSNGLLESPTGTGKTLSLLCASLAWQRKQRSVPNDSINFAAVMGLARPPGPSVPRPDKWNHANNVPPPKLDQPKIIYCSRTHSQLSQAIQELKRSFYRNTKAVVLGSRDVMCIHEEVSRMENSAAKNMACQIRVRAHTCVYYNNVQQKKGDSLIQDQAVVDIEDLVSKGKKIKACPFFLSREIVQEAEVVFMPYNYVLDPKLRATHGIDLYNSVVILDEGHNIAKVCEESLSFEIKSSSVALCIQELTRGLNDFNDTTQQLAATGNALLKDLSLEGLIRLKQAFLTLEPELNKIETTPEGVLHPGNTLLSVLFNNGFPPSALPRMISELEALSTFLAGNHFETTGCNTFSSILRILASPSMQRNPTLFGDSYKVFVKPEESKYSKGDPKSFLSMKNDQAKVFSFWCFNPAVGLGQMVMQGPRCIILSSGTLSPMKFLARELQLSFPVQLSNPHIIGDGQLFASIVKTGPHNIKLSSAYNNRNDPKYLKSLGDLIAQVCSVVPKGVLVFFPSYSVMEACSNAWQLNGQWESIARQKKVLMEPRGKQAFRQIMDDYYEAVKTNRGGCLMAVCRGKVSEGLDFTDDNGRCVIITGIPYSPAMDPQVKAKQQYLNCKNHSETAGINGNQWYQLEASRAMNQAMGRIIRHSQDYGAILLCDERCDGFQIKQNLPKWVQTRMKIFTGFDGILSDLRQFFGAAAPRALEYAHAKRLNSVTLQSRTLNNSVVKIPEKDATPKELKNLYASIRTPDVQVLEKTCVSEMFEDLVSTTVKKPGHSNTVPVHLKSYPAFAKSSNPGNTGINFSGSTYSQKRKRIRLTKNPIKIQIEPETLFSSCVGTSSETKPKELFSIFDSQTESSSSRPRITTTTKEKSSAVAFSPNFKTIPEFWQWTKKVLDPGGVTAFASCLKTYKKDKNVESLRDRVGKLFGKDSIDEAILGLKLVIPNVQTKCLR